MNKPISKRFFVKILGGFAILGFLLPMFGKKREDDLTREYPMEAKKARGAVQHRNLA